MANAHVDIVGLSQVPLIMDLYNQVFRPSNQADFFRRRFLGRYNPLLMIATLDKRAVGFYLGFELKPTCFFTWLIGTLPECRRMGVASQLIDAAHEWVTQHGYGSIRFECQNLHRPMLRLAIDRGYDVVGIRWDADRASNLVIFEKLLNPEAPVDSD